MKVGSGYAEEVLGNGLFVLLLVTGKVLRRYLEMLVFVLFSVGKSLCVRDVRIESRFENGKKEMSWKLF